MNLSREEVRIHCKVIRESCAAFTRNISVDTLEEHDAVQRARIEQQAKKITALRDVLDWDGLRISNDELGQALKYLGPTGNKAEAQIQAAVEYLIYMRKKAQAALQEES